MTEESKPSEKKGGGMKSLGKLVGVLFWAIGAFQAMNALTTMPQGAIQQAVASVWGLTAIVAFGFGSVLVFRN